MKVFEVELIEYFGHAKRDALIRRVRADRYQVEHGTLIMHADGQEAPVNVFGPAAWLSVSEIKSPEGS